MRAIPPEIYAYIIELACTDDIATYRSLTLVSTYISELTKPWRFYVVSARGTVQIVALLERLKGIPERLRRVRHLQLSDTPSEGKPQAGQNIVAYQGRNELTAHLVAIFYLLAPTLYTLALDTQC